MKKNILFMFLMAIVAISACSSPEGSSDSSSVDKAVTLHAMSVSIPVGGMTCGGCEKAIAKNIETLPGIVSVSASHVDSLAVVEYDENLVTEDQIKSKITETGYQILSK